MQIANEKAKRKASYVKTRQRVVLNEKKRIRDKVKKINLEKKKLDAKSIKQVKKINGQIGKLKSTTIENKEWALNEELKLRNSTIKCIGIGRSRARKYSDVVSGTIQFRVKHNLESIKKKANSPTALLDSLVEALSAIVDSKLVEPEVRERTAFFIGTELENKNAADRIGSIDLIY